MQRQFGADDVFQADQDYADMQFFRSLDGSFYLPLGSEVAPHGVDRDRQHGRALGTTPHLPRSLRGPYISRSEGKRDAAFFFRGSWGIRPIQCAAGNRAFAGQTSAAW